MLSVGVRDVSGDSGAIEVDDFDRFLGGSDSCKAGKAPRLIFTGGWSEWKPNLPLDGDVLMARPRPWHTRFRTIHHR